MSNRKLSVHKEHELLQKLEDAGMNEELAQAVIESRGNKLAKGVVAFIANGGIATVLNRASNTLSDLFDRQIETLRDRGCPNQVLARLIEQKPQVLAKASTIVFKDNRIPFLPIIPFSLLNLSIQMSMVKNGNQNGFTNLKANEIKDIVSTPNQPYYIFDVEDGTDMLGRSVRKATELIKSQDRSPLTAAEVISLSIQTDVLSKHFVDAGGSRYESDAFAPLLYLFGSRPGLVWNVVAGSYDRYGSASCGSRS